MDEFGTQIEQLIPRLRRYARALTGERSIADDLVQDTLERAWVKLHLWRRGSDLRAWLFTIMHNTYVNQVRRRMAQSTVPLEDDALDAPVRPSQTDLLELQDLEAALQRLPDEQREVLLLIALEHLSYEETARTLGIPVGTVMSRLHRGRERLRRLIDTAAAGNASLRIVK